MLDGFVVPHAHFRVFHGNAAAESTCRTSVDPLALVLSPRRAEAVPTDLHLREFAQLEAHIKALQQQQQPAAPYPTSRLVTTAQSAPLAECFSFYARLLTPESFTWPDFLTIVFAKLTEHFVASESELVRKAILDVFRGGQAHIARVTDATKIATLIRGLLGQHGDRASTMWALKLVETMPSLVKDNESIRTSVLRSLTADDAGEKRLAVAAARAMLPLSSAMRRAVFPLILSSNTAVLVTLMPVAIEEGDRSGFEQAWSFCASLFHDQVSEEDALQCLRAAGEIAAVYREGSIAQQLQLVRYVVTKDPRADVVANVWTTCEESVTRIAEPSDQANFLDIVSLQLRSDATPAVQKSALRILNLFCAKHVQAQVPVETVARARTIASMTPQHKSLFAQLLSHCVRRELAGIDQEPDDARIQSAVSLNEMIQLLKPTQFIRNRRVWMEIAAMLKDLTLQFPASIGSYVGECYLQLVHIARRKQLSKMEAALWLELSYVSVHCPNVISENAELLLSDSILSMDAKSKQAVAVCLVSASHLCTVEDRDVWFYHCLQLTADSDNDRYVVARVAMSQGASQFAGHLLKPIAEALDNDVFGSWIRALVAISEATATIGSEERVTIGTHQRLAEGKAFLEAVASAQYPLDLHVAFLDARLKWMELMLQAQQFAGENAHSRCSGGFREQRLGESFRANAAAFLTLRSKLLCSSASDRDVLVYHAQLSSLLGDAVTQLLVQEPTSADAAADYLPSSGILVASSQNLSTLQVGIQDKARRLAALDATRRPLVGATVFTQLLRAVCTLPSPLPRQFFRSQVRPYDQVRCNLQLLTQSEVTSTGSKPRTRSQLGVAFGSEFTSSLHGAVAFPHDSAIRPKTAALRVTVTLAVEKAEASAMEGTTQHVTEMTLPLDTAGNSVTAEWNYAAVEAPIVVSSELLKSKGTYTIHTTARLVDVDGEAWELALSGGRRGIIVY